MRFFVGATIALIAAPQLAHAQQPELAKPGQACGARSDCREGLRCLRNVCVDEATFDASQPRETSPGHRDEGTHGYVGGAFGMSLPAFWGQWGEGFQLAVRLGALTDGHVQFQLEVSPATTALLNMAPSAMGLVDVTGTIAYLVPLSDMVSWILRVGGGGGLVFGVTCSYCTAGAPVSGFGEFRLDVFGVAIKTSERMQFEINVPSFRVMIHPSGAYPFNNVMMLWLTSVGLNYLF